MAKLAGHLGNNRKLILERWRLATEEAPGGIIGSTLTRVQFNDHIPGVLDVCGRVLRAWPKDPSASAQIEKNEQISEHGF